MKHLRLLGSKAAYSHSDGAAPDSSSCLRRRRCACARGHQRNGCGHPRGAQRGRSNPRRYKWSPREVPVQVTKEVVVTQEVQVTVIAQPTPTDPPPLPGISGGSYPIVNSGFPARWDPHLAGTLPEIGSISPLYNQVVEYNPIKPDEIIGDLAVGWETNADSTSYVFTIREGVKWSDGEDLTAEDVAFSINRMIEEGEPRPRAGLLRTSTKNAEVIDSSKVQVNLNFPDASFLPFPRSGLHEGCPQASV